MKINISIDDISPHPATNTNCLQYCHKLIEDFPDIKFTLFIPTSYTRFADGDTDVTQYNLLKHPNFVKEIRALNEINFEIGLHGSEHGRENPISNNDEFANSSYEEAYDIVGDALDTMYYSGLLNDNKFSHILRPSAYRMSAEAIRAARDMRIKALGLHSYYAYLVYYGDEYKKKNDIVWADAHPPTAPLLYKQDKLEIVYHALKKDINYFSEERMTELKNFLITQENITFCWFEEMLDGKE